MGDEIIRIICHYVLICTCTKIKLVTPIARSYNVEESIMQNVWANHMRKPLKHLLSWFCGIKLAWVIGARNTLLHMHFPTFCCNPIITTTLGPPTCLKHYFLLRAHFLDNNTPFYIFVGELIKIWDCFLTSFGHYWGER